MKNQCKSIGKIYNIWFTYCANKKPEERKLGVVMRMVKWISSSGVMRTDKIRIERIRRMTKVVETLKESVEEMTSRMASKCSEKG